MGITHKKQTPESFVHTDRLYVRTLEIKIEKLLLLNTKINNKIESQPYKISKKKFAKILN